MYDLEISQNLNYDIDIVQNQFQASISTHGIHVNMFVNFSRNVHKICISARMLERKIELCLETCRRKKITVKRYLQIFPNNSENWADESCGEDPLRRGP